MECDALFAGHFGCGWFELNGECPILWFPVMVNTVKISSTITTIKKMNFTFIDILKEAKCMFSFNHSIFCFLDLKFDIPNMTLMNWTKIGFFISLVESINLKKYGARKNVMFWVKMSKSGHVCDVLFVKMSSYKINISVNLTFSV